MERSALTISLYAPDIVKTIAFYVEVLGFEKTAEWNDESGKPDWSEIARDGPKGTARIWLFSTEIERVPGPAMSGVIYIFVDNVDAEAQRIGSRATIVWGPETQEYGLRELGLEDPNGYLICLARDV